MILADGDINGAVKEAARIFTEGGVFIYPTDTIYGIGGDPFNPDCTLRINKMKRRDESKKFIFLADNLQRLTGYTDVAMEKHFDFLDAVWPDPVSVILKLNHQTVALLGQTTAGFRVPRSGFCVSLIAEVKKPLISTSVNRSGGGPMTEPDAIYCEFGSEVNAVFYTEKKLLRLGSTIIDLTDSVPVLVREGAVKFSELMGKFR
ncbi:MAG: L-threonylcarbamoyladenylate synthase [Ignavibacteria bacterium]